MPDSTRTVPDSAAVAFFRNPQLPFVLLRLLLYLVLVQAFTYELFWMASLAGLPQRPALNPQSLILFETIRLAGVIAAAWVLSRLERRNFGDLGLPLRKILGKHFWQGAAFGLLEISAVVGTLAALGYYRFGAIEIHGAALVRWMIFWLAFFLAVGLFEEFAFRGYAQFALTQGAGFWLASLVTSMTFGVVHLTNPGETWSGIAGVCLIGLFWCFTLQRTGSLWFAVGMHTAFDFGETFLYSVPDSGTVFPGHLSGATLAGPAWLAGGTAGPEASILDFLVLLILFYGFDRLYPASPRLPTSDLASADQKPPQDFIGR